MAKPLLLAACTLLVFSLNIAVLAYDLVITSDMPANINGAWDFSVPVSIRNLGNDAHSIEVTAKIYRGSKGFWNSTYQYFLEANETLDYTFAGKLSLEPGSYRFKVQVRKDDQKTTHDTITDFNMTGNTIINKQKTFVENPSDLYTDRKAAIYILLFVSIGLNIVLIWKR